MANIALTPLTADDRKQFILDNQRAFKYGAMEEFGERNSRFEESGEIISRRTIESCIDKGAAYRIREDGKIVIQPQPHPLMGHAEASFDSPLGCIESAWCYVDGWVEYTVTIPANTTAVFLSPSREQIPLKPGRNTIIR